MPTSTLREHLEDARRAPSIEQFEASRNVDPAASWAVWGSDVGDLTIFDDAASLAPKLRTDVILIGANFGMQSDGGWAPLKNFHTRASGGDAKLRNGLQGTPLEGAFMTDLVRDYPTPYANGLAKLIKSGELDVEAHVRRGFFAEQEALGLDRDTLYIPVGRTTRELWDLLVRREVLPAQQRVFHRFCSSDVPYRGRPVHNLRHYSSAVNMPEAVDALLAQRLNA